MIQARDARYRESYTGCVAFSSFLAWVTVFLRTEPQFAVELRWTNNLPNTVLTQSILTYRNISALLLIFLEGANESVCSNLMIFCPILGVVLQQSTSKKWAEKIKEMKTYKGQHKEFVSEWERFCIGWCRVNLCWTGMTWDGKDVFLTRHQFTYKLIRYESSSF